MTFITSKEKPIRIQGMTSPHELLLTCTTNGNSTGDFSTVLKTHRIFHQRKI